MIICLAGGLYNFGAYYGYKKWQGVELPQPFAEDWMILKRKMEEGTIPDEPRLQRIDLDRSETVQNFAQFLLDHSTNRPVKTLMVLKSGLYVDICKLFHFAFCLNIGERGLGKSHILRQATKEIMKTVNGEETSLFLQRPPSYGKLVVIYLDLMGLSWGIEGQFNLQFDTDMDALNALCKALHKLRKEGKECLLILGIYSLSLSLFI